MDEVRIVETPSEPIQPRVLRVEQAAEYLNVSRGTIYRELAEGRLPSVKIRTRVLIPEFALQRWLEEQVQNR